MKPLWVRGHQLKSSPSWRQIAYHTCSGPWSNVSSNHTLCFFFIVSALKSHLQHVQLNLDLSDCDQIKCLNPGQIKFCVCLLFSVAEGFLCLVNKSLRAALPLISASTPDHQAVSSYSLDSAFNPRPLNRGSATYVPLLFQHVVNYSD